MSTTTSTAFALFLSFFHASQCTKSLSTAVTHGWLSGDPLWVWWKHPSPTSLLPGCAMGAAAPSSGHTGRSQVWCTALAKTTLSWGWPFSDVLDYGQYVLTEVATVFPLHNGWVMHKAGWVIRDLCFTHYNWKQASVWFILTRFLLVKPQITLGITDMSDPMKCFRNKWRWDHVVRF